MAVIKPGISKVGEVWTIRVQIQRNGRPYDKKAKVVGITLAKALALQAEMRVQLEAESGQAEPPASQETFEAYHEFWLEHLRATGKASHSTVKVRKATAKALLNPYFGKMEVRKITRRDIALWMRWLSEKRKPDGTEYAKEYFGAAWRDLKSALSDARDLLNLKENPSEAMDFAVQGKDPKQKDALTLEETKKLLAQTEHESFDIAVMIWIAVTTGMRFGEITALVWSDIIWEKNYIKVGKSQVDGAVGKTKGKIHRYAPLHPDVKPLLLAHRSDQRKSKILNVSPLVFPSNVGTYRFPNVLIAPLQRCCEKAEITKHITAHSLRRTCNNLVRVNLGDVAARKMLGHVSESQTARYSVVEPEELITAQAASFGSLLERPEAPKPAAPTQPAEEAAVVPIDQKKAQ